MNTQAFQTGFLKAAEAMGVEPRIAQAMLKAAMVPPGGPQQALRGPSTPVQQARPPQTQMMRQPMPMPQRQPMARPQMPQQMGQMMPQMAGAMRPQIAQPLRQAAPQPIAQPQQSGPRVGPRPAQGGGGMMRR
jgi:hypothetical protein